MNCVCNFVTFFSREPHYIQIILFADIPVLYNSTYNNKLLSYLKKNNNKKAPIFKRSILNYFLR